MADIAAANAQGVNAFGALQNQARQRMAYNALVSAYGPQAADPEAWNQATEAATKTALLPGAVAAQNAETGYKNAATGNLTAETATTNAKLPFVAPEAQADVGLKTAQAQSAQVKAAQDKLGSIATIAAAALKGDPNTDPGMLFDTLAPSIKGVHPDLTDEHLAQMRAGFVKDAPGTLAAMLNPTPKVEAGTQNGQPAFVAQDALGRVTPASTTGGVAPAAPIEGAGEPFTQGGQWFTQYHRKDGSVVNIPLPKGAEPQTAYDAQQLRALGYTRLTGEAGGVVGNAPPPVAPGEKPPVPGTGDKRAVPADSRYARLVTQKDKDAANDAAKSAVTVADGVAQAKPLLQQVLTQLTPYSTGPGTLLKDLPGSIQNNLRRNLESLKANEFLTVVQGMKNGKGQSGIGRVLQSEVPMMQAAYGNMAQDQTVGQLAQHVSLLAQLLDRSVTKAAGGFKAAYGADPYDVAGVAPYNPQMTTPRTGAAAAQPTPDEARAELARRKGK